MRRPPWKVNISSDVIFFAERNVDWMLKVCHNCEFSIFFEWNMGNQANLPSLAHWNLHLLFFQYILHSLLMVYPFECFPVISSRICPLEATKQYINLHKLKFTFKSKKRSGFGLYGNHSTVLVKSMSTSRTSHNLCTLKHIMGKDSLDATGDNMSLI